MRRTIIYGAFILMAMAACKEIQATQIHVILNLDSDGTVTDDARLQLGNDGKGYFAILIYNE